MDVATGHGCCPTSSSTAHTCAWTAPDDRPFRCASSNRSSARRRGTGCRSRAIRSRRTKSGRPHHRTVPTSCARHRSYARCRGCGSYPDFRSFRAASIRRCPGCSAYGLRSCRGRRSRRRGSCRARQIPCHASHRELKTRCPASYRARRILYYCRASFPAPKTRRRASFPAPRIRRCLAWRRAPHRRAIRRYFCRCRRAFRFRMRRGLRHGRWIGHRRNSRRPPARHRAPSGARHPAIRVPCPLVRRHPVLLGPSFRCRPCSGLRDPWYCPEAPRRRCVDVWLPESRIASRRSRDRTHGHSSDSSGRVYRRTDRSNAARTPTRTRSRCRSEVRRRA